MLHRMIVVMIVKKEFSIRMAKGLNIPSETVCNVPVGTFRGKGELLLENHCGIQIYEKEHIRIAVKRGAVVIRGRNLTITNMSPTALRIKGVITVIELE